VGRAAVNARRSEKVRINNVRLRKVQAVISIKDELQGSNILMQIEAKEIKEERRIRKCI